MPGDCIPSVMTRARASLDDWIRGQERLCDLERATFPNFPYDEAHCRALYQLRYFPAYFYENFEMFSRLRGQVDASPRIVSLGCGCLVDAAAAADVFVDGVAYDGYDINNWEIKAISLDEDIHFHHENVFEQDCFPHDANVFVFSRSIGDLATRLGYLNEAIVNSELDSEQIFLCATYNLDGACINRLQTYLSQFAEQFEAYTRAPGSQLYHPAGQSVENCGFAAGRPWVRHPEVDYLRNLSGACRNPRPNCPGEQCVINRSPILTIHHLAFEILTLNRR